MKRTVCPFLIAVFLTASCFINAQSSDDPVKIEVLKDNPEDINFIRLGIPLWHLNLNNYNLSAYDLNFSFISQLGDIFYFQGSYNYSLLDRLSPDLQSGENSSMASAVSIYEDTRANELALEGTYFFKKLLTRKDMRIKLKSHSTGNVTVETVTYVPGNESKRYGLRLGWCKGITWYGMDSQNITGTDSQGKEFEMDFQDKSTMMQYSNLRIGFCRSIQTNLHVNAQGYGYRHTSGMTYLYGDVVLALSNQLDDVLGAYYFDGQGAMYYRPFEIDSHVERSKIGFAIGYRDIPISSVTGFMVEAGAFPGVKGEGNGYLKIGISAFLGTSEKIKKSEQKGGSKNLQPPAIH
jgi:hypothetical protein